ncbi:MAG: hypothetical protein WAM70_01255, partial [Pyrinomonadaceae bacterium]
MSAKRRKSRKQSITNEHYQKQLKRTTFFLERSLGGEVIRNELRKAGLRVEQHKKWFRHDTADEVWLPKVGRRRWIVLMRDQKIGKRPLELDALLYGGVQAFALISGQLRDSESAKIIIKALPNILEKIEQHPHPFIAKILRNSTVV